jgi:hypothetical protein
MQRSVLRALTFAGLLIALTMVTSSCNRDCPTCLSLWLDPPPKSVAFELCVSRLPVSEAEEERCAAIEVRYVQIDD